MTLASAPTPETAKQQPPVGIAFFDEPTDFSLVQGGPLFQLLLRAGLVRPPLDLVGRRIIAILLIAWLPLLIISEAEGRLFGGTAIPFVYDLGAQARFLLSIPLLIAAEVIVHARIKVTVRQFIDRGIVLPADRPLFEQCITSAMRLRNSTFAEVLLLVIAILAGYFAGRRYVDLRGPTWFAVVPAGQPQHRLTIAGYWYFFVSLTIFRFLLLRWLFRLLVWSRFLWHVARRIPLQLNGLHPDGSGGLGFLASSAFAFQPLLFAISVGISGIIGNKIWHDGARLPQFKLEIFAWILFMLLMVLAPQCSFIVKLAATKRAAAREYGIVASRYVADFRRKWIEGHAPAEEALLGSADIQSLADLGNSFSIVREMRLVPFSRATVVPLVITTALPFAPLLLTVIPFEALVDRLLGVFF
jgi:hypothetical protein